MYSLDHIFKYHAPKPGQPEKYELLRAAAKKYAEALITDRPDDQDSALALELAYEDYVRVIADTLPLDSPEYSQVMKFVDEAYDVAFDYKHYIVQKVQAASMFANAAIALNT